MSFTSNYIKNYISYLLGRTPTRPLMFSYYITHRCNLNCVYCSDGEGNKFSEQHSKELSTKKSLELIKIISTSADTLDITGGEPLMRKDLADILAAAKSFGMRTILNTNGIGIKEREDVINNTDILAISLDSLNTEKLGALVGGRPKDAEQILENIEAVKAHKNVVLSAVVTPSNIADITEVFKYAEENKFGFHLSPEIIGKTANPKLKNNSEYTKLLDTMIQHKSRGAAILGVKQYLKGIREFSNYKCWPELMPTIRPDGNLYYPCLEESRADVSLLDYSTYELALKEAKRLYGASINCRDRCQIFCHMGMSLLQRHPVAALKEQANV